MGRPGYLAEFRRTVLVNVKASVQAKTRACSTT